MLKLRFIKIAGFFLFLLSGQVLYSASPGIQGISGFSPNSVSADGSVVVGTRDTDEGWEAAKWENGQVTGLGFISDEPSLWYSNGTAVSEDGSTAVGISNSGLAFDWISEAFRWQNGVMTGIGVLGSDFGTLASYAADVSGDGSVVIGYSTYGDGEENGGQEQAFRWENGQMTGLGFLDNSPYDLYPLSRATGVSADGSVVVGNSTSLNIYEDWEEVTTQAFRWENGQMTGLGFLDDSPYNPSPLSRATGISSDGLVIIGYSTSIMFDDDMEYVVEQAFRWEDGQMTGLGLLEEYVSTWAVAISDDGLIIGNSSEPFVWDTEHGIRSLAQFLMDSIELDLSGWSDLFVTDISSDGKTIIGIGYNLVLDDFQGFIITIPEPTSILLIGIGAVVLRKRKSD